MLILSVATAGIATCGLGTNGLPDFTASAQWRDNYMNDLLSIFGMMGGVLLVVLTLAYRPRGKQ